MLSCTHSPQATRTENQRRGSCFSSTSGFKQFHGFTWLLSRDNYGNFQIRARLRFLRTVYTCARPPSTNKSVPVTQLLPFPSASAFRSRFEQFFLCSLLGLNEGLPRSVAFLR